MLFDPAKDTWTPDRLVRKAPPQIVPRERVMTAAERSEARRGAVLARRLASDTLSPSMKVLAECALESGLNVADLLAAGRRGVAVPARRKAMYRLWTELGWSLSKIGRRFGRDHTGVMHAVGMHALQHGLPATEGCFKRALRQQRERA
jgi:hypothetical protein